MDESTKTLLFFILCVLVIVIGVIYIILKNDGRKMYMVFPEVMTLPAKQEFLQNDTEAPTTPFGREYSYSFWMYVKDSPQTSEKKILFRRGPADAPTFMAYVDAEDAKLNVLVKMHNIDKNSGIDFERDTCSYRAITLDYIPIQRWINILVTIDNDVITLYVDGQIYKVLNTRRIDNCNKTTVTKPTGKFMLGNYGSSNIDGWIAKVQYFNYSLTASRARAIYAAGPQTFNRLRQAFNAYEFGGIVKNLTPPVFQLNSWDQIIKKREDTGYY